MLEVMDAEARDRAHFEAAEEGAELLREGELVAAERELTELIERDPENPYGYFYLGATLFETEDFLRSLKAYLRAVELKPDYLGALIGAGFALHSLGRFREAMRVGRQVLLRVKEDPDALHLLGLCHYALGEGAAAMGYLNRFLATRPELEVALEVEGMLRILRGDVQPLTEED
jgi:tetratricopeptide (TPR) repeat protein